MSTSRPLKNLVQFIRHKEGRPEVWRANPNDPYIYLSFSIDQFLAANGNANFLEDKNMANTIEALGPQLTSLDKDVINLFKATIRREWMDKAGLPVKFLPENISGSDIRDKNVCFIIGPKRAIGDANPVYATLSVRHASANDQPNENARSDHKFILFPNIEMSEMNNRQIYALLHEVGHAVVELKHSLKIDATDVAPFQEMDCTESVMAYDDNCVQAVIAKVNVLNSLDEKTKSKGLSINDPDPVVQKKIKLILNAFPTSIGSVDLLAATDFKKSWEDRNELAKSSQNTKRNKKKKKKAAIPEKPTHQEEAESKGQCELQNPEKTLGLGKWFDNFVSDLSECKTYFNPQQTYYSANRSLTLFGASSATHQTHIGLTSNMSLQIQHR